MNSTRRDFLTFMGSQIAFATGVGTLISSVSGCTTTTKVSPQLTKTFKTPKVLFKSLAPTNQDNLVLAEGLTQQLLIKWTDPISRTETFGTNNDYLALIKDSDTTDEYYFWSNHEYLKPLFVSGFDGTKPKTKQQVITEQESVGGSILKLKKDALGKFSVIKNHPANKKVSGRTKIPFAAGVKINGNTHALGTFANCAGGVTPWNTFLTCEENYDDFYGDIVYDENNKKTRKPSHPHLGWEKFFNENPENYGWVVEVNPKTGAAKKLTALGRFAHEGATPIVAKDGRTVVYMGDDANDQCIYKFISSKPNSLESGELYVADTLNGKWLSLNIKNNEILKKRFKNQLEVNIRCREAAKLIGGTPLNRPEDVEIHPFTNEIYFTQTNNKNKSDYHGQISKIKELNDDHLSMEFEISTFVTGGEKLGLSCPDNLVFDNKGNLWVTTDISGSATNKPPYDLFKNNGLFFIPTSGEHAGEVFQVASAPNDAEITGPFFTEDYKNLFISIQHPGEESKSLTELTSHWPEGGNAIPKSAVVILSGPALEAITG